MKAGDLRHRITIQQLTSTNSGEATVESWADFLTNVPAAISPLSGREILAAGAEQSGTRVRFVIRYGNGTQVTSSMRIVHNSATYNITEVIADPTLRDSFTLLAEAGIRG